MLGNHKSCNKRWMPVFFSLLQVRVWNPFVPRRATVTFLGHHAGIVALVFQDKGAKLASLSKDKCIKVWDVTAQVCLQTYLGLPAELGERTALTLLYNAESREMIIGERKKLIMLRKGF